MTVVVDTASEQSRARYPDEQGYVERDGVKVFWERYGDAPTAVLLFPTDTGAWAAYGSNPRRLKTARPGNNGSYVINSVPPGEYSVTSTCWKSPGRPPSMSYVSFPRRRSTRMISPTR